MTTKTKTNDQLVAAFSEAVDIYAKRRERYEKKLEDCEEMMGKLVSAVQEEYTHLEHAHHELAVAAGDLVAAVPEDLRDDREKVAESLGYSFGVQAEPLLSYLLWGPGMIVMPEMPDVPSYDSAPEVPSVFYGTVPLSRALQALQECARNPPAPPAEEVTEAHPLTGAIEAARLLLSELEKIARG